MPDALLVTSSFLPGRGGIESYLAALCAELTPRLAVLAPAERDGTPIPELPYAAHGYRGGSMLVPSPAVRDAIVALALYHGVERVLFGTPWPLALLAPGLARRGLRTAAIVHGAELVVPDALPGLGRILAHSLATTELLLTVSEFTGARTRTLLRSHGLRVPRVEPLRARPDLQRFNPGVDTGPTRARLGLAEGDRVLLSFGRLVRRKGVHRLLAALPAIAPAVPEAVAVVAGTGPEEQRLRRLAARLPGRVVFAGRVPDEEAPAFYAMADVFVMPVVDRYFGLDIEGLGVVLLEAAACGTPCVTGRSGGTPEAIVDGETGYVIDASNRSAMVEAIVRLLKDPAQARRMGRKGREHVAARFCGAAALEPLLAWLDQGVPWFNQSLS